MFNLSTLIVWDFTFLLLDLRVCVPGTEFRLVRRDPHSTGPWSKGVSGTRVHLGGLSVMSHLYRRLRVACVPSSPTGHTPSQAGRHLSVSSWPHSVSDWSVSLRLCLATLRLWVAGIPPSLPDHTPFLGVRYPSVSDWSMN